MTSRQATNTLVVPLFQFCWHQNASELLRIHVQAVMEVLSWLVPFIVWEILDFLTLDPHGVPDCYGMNPDFLKLF